MDLESDVLTINASTASTSATTGALIVTGGIGTEKDVVVGGFLDWGTTPYICAIRNTVTQSMTAATIERLVFNTADYDPSTMRSGNFIICPVTGFYHVWSNIYVAQQADTNNRSDDPMFNLIERTDSSSVNIEYRRFSSNILTNTAAPQVGAYMQQECVLQCDATDRIHLAFYNISQNTTIGLAGDYPWTHSSLTVRYLGDA